MVDPARQWVAEEALRFISSFRYKANGRSTWEIVRKLTALQASVLGVALRFVGDCRAKGATSFRELGNLVLARLKMCIRDRASVSTLGGVLLFDAENQPERRLGIKARKRPDDAGATSANVQRCFNKKSTLFGTDRPAPTQSLYPVKKAVRWIWKKRGQQFDQLQEQT